MNTELIVTAALLGVGLAMDAFSVSLADGLADSEMKMKRMAKIAGVFAVFQFAMPMAGWFAVHTAASKLMWFSRLVPWIALVLLLYIGGKMLKEGIANRKNPEKVTDENTAESGSGLIMQGIATSIDALSVGFTISAYGIFQASASSLIIGTETFVICMTGLAIGKKAGTLLSGKASILGGVILIGIGLEIWIRGALL